MSIPRVIPLVTALALATAPLAAQARPATPAAIDPGMPRDSVVARFGPPAGEHARGAFTYLFYGNGRERRVGTADVVILEEGRGVIDAILRHPDRRYSGRSSSPQALPAAEAARRSAAARTAPTR